MTKGKMPEFVIYQASPKEFHVCFRVGDRYLRWCSYYAPAQDVRFAREVTRIGDIAAAKLPAKPVYDKGTYTVHKQDSKAEAEQKLAAGAGERSFAFILDGKKLQGRFLLKNNGTRTVLQKYKDKYATEEDVLAGDLERTIQAMLPGYDEAKVKLPRRERARRRPAIKKPAPGAVVQKPVPAQERPSSLKEKPAGPKKPSPGKRPQKAATKKEKPVRETADKKTGRAIYHFTFYTSATGDQLCLATGSGGAVVLQLIGRQWRLLPPAGKAVLQHEKALAAQVKGLYKRLQG